MSTSAPSSMPAVRGRFSYGPRDSTPADESMDLDDLRRFSARWPAERLDGLLDFGVALRGPYRTPYSGLPERMGSRP